MPDSPSQDFHDPPPPIPHSHSAAQLATLLADALKDADALRRELAVTKKRADDIEHRFAALSSLADSKLPQADSARIIQEFDQRAIDAEAARDESESRRRLVLDNWLQLDRFLQTIEVRAADARASFAKIIAEGAGSLILATLPLPGGVPVPYSYPASGTMPPPPNHARTPYPSAGRPSSHGHRSTHSQSFPPMPLPPHPTPNGGTRRQREESLDRAGYVDALPGQPPPKKLKGFGDDRRGRDERTTYSESNLAYLHQRHQPLPPQAIDARERIYQERERRQPQARMIVPPTGESDHPNHRGRSRSRSRSSSHSSRSSLSVDEMLLEAANGNGTPASAGDTSSQRSHRRRRHREDATNQRYPPSNEPTLHTIQQQQQQQQQQPPQPQGQQQPHPPQRPQGDSPPPQQLIHTYRPRAPHASASVPLVPENQIGAMPAGCHVQPIQTHVFAPVVTGAPQKKNKFSASGASVGNLASGTGSSDAPPPTPQHVYPPANQQGQRICRQCGMPGRYKEGKCVEKWGPGPMGPGTVCDRCRKKMKRVERRGNLESQQLSATNSLSNVGSAPGKPASAKSVSAASCAAATATATATGAANTARPSPERASAVVVCSLRGV
ncbi:hypothetical protein APHAL10511_001482 [Amanita phalloides]|nr:hypothetical protein APHAL10511_001482 [Amanita phalloides]